MAERSTAPGDETFESHLKEAFNWLVTEPRDPVVSLDVDRLREAAFFVWDDALFHLWESTLAPQDRDESTRHGFAFGVLVGWRGALDEATRSRDREEA